MVKIKGIKAFRPVEPESFAIPPYDIIDEEWEKELKKNPRSSIHVILPDGEGQKVYENAEKEMQRLIDEEIIKQEDEPAIYLYRQEAKDEEFTQEGFIMGVSIKDYKEGRVKKHEHTREKPLKDRTAHISATRMNTGLVWTTYKPDSDIKQLKDKIKSDEPITEFIKFGYNNILWKCTHHETIQNLKQLFSDKPLYIADGHHRAASAAAYHDKMAKKVEMEGLDDDDANWRFFMVYAAADDQVRILPYNRVIRKLPLETDEFLDRIKDNFIVTKIEGNFKPSKKNEIGVFMNGSWYKLAPKTTDYGSTEKNLDVSIVQDLIIGPLLGIEDIRNDDNIFFVGGVRNPEEMAKYVTEKGNDMFLSLYPVKMTEIEDVADAGNVMPPKSTWFDPKLLSGLVFNPLS